jgi:glycerate 2-kinase
LTDDRDVPALLLSLWQAGIDAVQPVHCVPPHLPADRPAGRLMLFALGKAASSMAAVAMEHMPFDGGLIIAPHGTAFPPRPRSMAKDAYICLSGGHPVPDADSLVAGSAAMAFVSALRADDRMIALISGGGSALMVAPSNGLSLADKIAKTKQMLASGACISEINRERAALSQVKSGGLARLSGTRDIQTIIMSDVPGDDPTLVASGPTMAAGGAVTMCASAATMLAAVANAAQQAGLEVLNLGGAIEGDAAALGREHAAIALAAQQAGKALLILSGGETSVRVDYPDEAGGRNLTYALALADALDGSDGIVALAADSDGIDGNSAVAGALVDGNSAASMRHAGWVPGEALAHNRSYRALDAIGATIRTGPTGVNVNDLRMIYVGPGRSVLIRPDAGEPSQVIRSLG